MTEYESLKPEYLEYKKMCKGLNLKPIEYWEFSRKEYEWCLEMIKPHNKTKSNEQK